VRFLSCEPLLGDLDLENFIAPWTPTDTGMERKRLIDWVMVGGESGSRARLVNPAWVWSIQRQCREAGVAFWFKQWGGASTKAAGALLDGELYHERPEAGV
jgi:protein gp37